MNNFDRNKSSQIMRGVRIRTARRQLRHWQKKFLRHYFTLKQKFFLLTAAPGAGKSGAAAEIARELLELGRILRIVIVVPTEHLKAQWARTLTEVAVDLDPLWSNAAKTEAADYAGVIVSYQQVSADPAIYDYNCAQRPTLVIFDEIHHAADGMDWGDKLRSAFSRAELVLSLSGTPFRHDKNPIPFVRYNRQGGSMADFSYSYGEALMDRVCRPVYFPAFEGSATWLDGRGKEKSQSQFADLSKERASELLRALLDSESAWLRTVLREADEKLSEFRATGHADAGGLVIAIDQQHARQIGRLLQKITGEEAVIVISDDPDSSRALHEFSCSGSIKRWIVAVKMVSEGIDIPRLRVGVYATNILSELFFRQAVGRLVRVIEQLEEQSATFYLPAHPTLVKHAMAIKDERNHSIPHLLPRNQLAANSQTSNTSVSGQFVDLSEIIQSPENGRETPASTTNLQQTISENEEKYLTSLPDMHLIEQNDVDSPRSFRQIMITIRSEAKYQETIFDGQRFSDEELKAAEYHAKTCGINAPIEQLAAFLRAATGDAVSINTNFRKPINNQKAEGTDNKGTDNKGKMSFGADSLISNRDLTAQSPKSSPPADLYERKKHLRSIINKTANIVAYRKGMKPGQIHGAWTHALGEKPNIEATAHDLERKLEWLNHQLIEIEKQRDFY